MSDKKLGVDNNSDGIIDYYNADVITANDFYPFGMQMPGRKYSQSNTTYRYGFNGQENSDEIAAGLTTAMYWEYDSRIGRRWNQDPVVKDWESPYLCFSGNPIFFSDVNGDVGKPSNEPPAGQWYRKSEGNNLKYEYVLDQNKGNLNSKYELIPSGSRDRTIFGKGGNSSVKLNDDGTFKVVDSKGKETAGKSQWGAHLASGGYFEMRAKNYYQNQAVGGDGALVGAAEWLAGEKVASVVFKGAYKVLKPVIGKISSKVITKAIVKGGQNIALGVREHLDKFAGDVGAKTWKAWGTKDLETQTLEVINNSANKIHFNLDGIPNPWQAITDGAKGFGVSEHVTSWELFQIYSNKEALERTTFYLGGKIQPSPF